MSRVGELYKISENGIVKYFQFVAIDTTTLNSDVIAVFKSTASLKDNLKSLQDSEIDFFIHTTVNAGVKQGLWEKIGKSGVVDYSEALFKEVDYKGKLPDIEPYESDSYHSWAIWNVNGKWRNIGDKLDEYPSASLGAIYPPDETVHRIFNGSFSGTPYYGETK